MSARVNPSQPEPNLSLPESTRVYPSLPEPNSSSLESTLVNPSQIWVYPSLPESTRVYPSQIWVYPTQPEPNLSLPELARVAQFRSSFGSVRIWARLDGWRAKHRMLRDSLLSSRILVHCWKNLERILMQKAVALQSRDDLATRLMTLNHLPWDFVPSFQYIRIHWTLPNLRLILTWELQIKNWKKKRAQETWF